MAIKMYVLNLNLIPLLLKAFFQILITTGGESWLAESMQQAYLDCPELDIVAIHIYNTNEFSVDTLKGAVDQAKKANKLTIVQEWCVNRIWRCFIPRRM